MSRIICWFSCGVASAVATKLTIKQHKKNKLADELIIANIPIKNEHFDSLRFLKDCEKWFRKKITFVEDSKYDGNVDNVIASTRYMSGVYGARCTKELKKAVRYKFKKDGDINVFGMSYDEKVRIDRLIDSEPDIELYNPLIDHKITKAECFKIVKRANIELPAMYKLGYHNNNCIGCLKAAGAGYWNKIRKDFPQQFEIRAEQEKMLNVALVKISLKKFKEKYPEHYKKMQEDHKKNKCDMKISGNSIRVPLRYLPEKAGTLKELDIGSCGFFCEPKDGTEHA